MTRKMTLYALLSFMTLAALGLFTLGLVIGAVVQFRALITNEKKTTLRHVARARQRKAQSERTN